MSGLPPKDIQTEIDNRTLVRRVIRENLHIYKNQYLIAGCFMLMTAATTAFMAYIIRNVVNDVFEARNLDMAWIVAALVFLIFFVRGIAAYGQEIFLNRIGNNIVARYQVRTFDHMLKLGLGFHLDTRSAFLVGKMSQSINGVRSMLNQLITVVARDFLTLAGLVTVMIVQDPEMALGSLLILPIVGYVLSRYVKRIRTISRKNVTLNARVNSAMIESAQGIAVLKGFTMERQMQDKLDNLISVSEKQSNTMALIAARTKPLTETLGGIAIAGAIAFGGWRVIEFGADPGAQLSFLAAAMLAFDPARRLTTFRVNFEKSLVNARMLYELLDTPPRQADKPGAPDLDIGKAEVRLDDVFFAYPGGEKVLDGISLVAKAGKTTALVGPSGGGKTTIINLIQRFHDLDAGAITIDGQNIADVTVTSLRRNIAYVSQQPVLFEGTIADNIRYARPEATQAEIEEAARLAQAHDFIASLPEGYDTEVGEMGSNFSGGQRQRLSIARAVLRNAPILLLDEATSALDNESEKLVQEALDRLMQGRTTIVVAHRLSTIRNADLIAVVDKGRIVEQGNHAQLIKKGSGLYSRLHSLT